MRSQNFQVLKESSDFKCVHNQIKNFTEKTCHCNTSDYDDTMISRNFQVLKVSDSKCEYLLRQCWQHQLNAATTLPLSADAHWPSVSNVVFYMSQ